jgi:glutaminyl-tRNA synthetase
MAVLQPLKLVITNLPEDHVEWLEAENNAENPELGSRQIPFTREVFIEADDFMEEPVKGYHRLYPGAEVRLRHAYFVKCHDFVKDAEGNVTEIHCTYDPETKSGSGFTGRKVKGVLHWVSAPHSIAATVRQYDYLMTQDAQGEPVFNENSLTVLADCRLEASLADAAAYDRYQFLRHGYFCVDYKDSKPGAPVFNQIVDLKSSWK